MHTYKNHRVQGPSSRSANLLNFPYQTPATKFNFSNIYLYRRNFGINMSPSHTTRQNAYSVGSATNPCVRSFSSISHHDKVGLKRHKLVRDPFIADTHWDKFLEFLLGEASIHNAGKLVISCYLMARTGLRISEVRLMKFGILRRLLERGVSRVKNIKRAGERDITMIKKHREELKLIMQRVVALYPTMPLFIGDMVNNKITKANDDFYICYSRDSYLEPANRTYFNELVDGHLAKLALTVDPEQTPRWTSHSFRIGYVTSLASLGLPMDKIQRFVGHKDIKTTILYSRYLESGEERLDYLEEYVANLENPVF